MKRTYWFVSLILAVLLVVPLSNANRLAAQRPDVSPFWAEGSPPKGGSDPLGPSYSLPSSYPQRVLDGTWYMSAGNMSAGAHAPVTAQDTGGPDDFGYAWDDAVSINWIDATSGTDTGMNGSSDAVGPIHLPFSFQYYENTYTSLYIVRWGYVGFTAGSWAPQPRVPSAATPNNIIAPYATPIDLASTGPANRVYYKSGGAAPNRYFVVEWYQASIEDEVYTFEVVLHESGDIVFQYQAMTYSGGYYCGAAGIEDAAGEDGLGYVGFCAQAPSNKAVRFYRPAPAARVGIKPLYQGHFTHAGEPGTFQVSIRNTGELGADTYDISFTSGWPTTFYAADGTTPLRDTDRDGVPDTGSVMQGGSVTVVARVSTPGIANVGDHNLVSATVRSSVDLGRSKIVTLQTGIPAPFAQAFVDGADGAMSLYLVHPAVQVARKATPNDYWGDYGAAAEAPNGNLVYAWIRGRAVGEVYVGEVEYTIVNGNSDTVRPVSKLTDHSGVTQYTFDETPVLAAAPDGRIAVLWYRILERYDESWLYLFNIYFAILDSAGNVVYAPQNLTNNTTWGTSDAVNVPQFFGPSVAATGDNRFVLAWTRDSPNLPGGACTDNCWVTDIYYAVRDSGGLDRKGITRLTSDTPGNDDAHYYPNVTALSGNRALLSWTRGGDSGDILYSVLDSSGNVIKEITNLAGDGTSRWDWRADAVQLTNGKTVVAWTSDTSIRFAVLDTLYGRVAGPTLLSHPAALSNAFVSVAAAGGQAVLSWTDYDSANRRNLYYALVDSSGALVTPPMIFRSSGEPSGYIETSFIGYGNTSYSSQPTFRAFLPAILKEYQAYWCDPYEPNDVRSQTHTNLVSGHEYQALICSGDFSDWYLIDVTTLTRISIDLSVPPAVDYDLYLYEEGKEDFSAKSELLGSGRPEHIEYTPMHTGRYYIRVYPYQGCSDNNHPYTLVARY